MSESTDTRLRVERALDRAAAGYAAVPALRAALAAVPVLGGALDAYWSAWGDSIRADRIEAMVNALTETVDQIGVDKIDRPFLESEEFYDIAARVMRASTETRDREKIRMYASILLGVASSERPESGVEAEAALASLVALTPQEVHILRLIIDKTAGGAWWPPHPSDVPEYLRADHDFHCKRIEAAGLIAQAGVWAPETAGGARFVPTPTLDRLVELLRAGGYRDPSQAGRAPGASLEDICVLCGLEKATAHMVMQGIAINNGDTVRYVEMPRLDVCARCQVEVVSDERDVAACPDCALWGPAGGRCGQCGGILISIHS